MGGTLNLAFLWHMHQPPYEEPRSGVLILPWTYLHAVKDYYDMGELARRHPRMRMNVNFTPSLLHQLDLYGRAALPDQTFLVMAKEPSRLTEADREFLLRTCMGIPDVMIARFPRYRQLHDYYRAFAHPEEAVLHFPLEDYLDLSVLFLLVWCGPTLLADPAVDALVRRGHGYTPEDRDLLLRLGRRLIRGIVPLYRELAAAGGVELMTSPFFHPLTPLVLSNSAAIESDPALELPYVRFSGPEEADRQLALGIEYFRQVFGCGCPGLWPPEGAVSEAAIQLFSARGIRYVATDEEILRRSLGGEITLRERLRPWRRNGLSIFFRDRVLSDHLGFVYARWPRQASVEHFMASLKTYADQVDDPSALVLIALDGENAWEFYPDGGYPFLDALYGAIEASDFVTPVTLSEYLDRFGPGEVLDHIATGSWVNGSLDTWIGDPVKNKAWSMLASTHALARDTPAGECRLADLVSGDPARCHLMRAEASDWFWWFGKGHSSIHEREFDFLFRQNLRMVYERLGVPAPDYLDRPVDRAQASMPVVPPTAFIQPAITGRRDGYYKWVGAGSCRFTHGSIHRLQPLIAGVSFGYGRDALYFGFEGFETLAPLFREDGWLRLQFVHPCDCAVQVRTAPGGLEVRKIVGGRDAGPVAGAEAAVDELLDLKVPVSFFAGALAGRPATLEFYAAFGEGGLEIERFPWDSVVSMEFDPEGFATSNWFV